jgi:hypothetical protein
MRSAAYKLFEKRHDKWNGVVREEWYGDYNSWFEAMKAARELEDFSIYELEFEGKKK